MSILENEGFRHGLLGIIGLAALLLTNCRQNETHPEASKPKHRKGADPPATYARNLRRALANSARDGLDRAFTIQGIIRLTGGPTKQTLTAARVTTDGSVVILDAPARAVRVFSPSGTYQHDLGRPGTRPGELTYPTDIVETEDGVIAVADFSSHRVQLFGLSGRFLYSFLYTPQRFSASRIAYDRTHKRIGLFGHRRDKDGITTLHEYTPSGSFVRSSMAPAPAQQALNLEAYADAALTAADGQFLAAFPYSYSVVATAPAAEPRTMLAHASKVFRVPSIPLQMEGRAPQSVPQYVREWRSTWTPVDNIAVPDSRHLLVTYQTFNPLRYTVDIWERRAKKLVQSLNTNRLLLTAGRDGSLYFLDNIEREEQSGIVLVKATM